MGRGNDRFGRSWRALVGVVAAASLAACTVDAAADSVSSSMSTSSSSSSSSPTTTRPRPSTTASTSTTSSTTTSGTTTSGTTTSTTTTATTTTATTTTATATTSTTLATADFVPVAVAAAAESLAADNVAVSVSVLRDGQPVFSRAIGDQLSGRALTTDTPMVVASVSKLVTALTVARLIEAGETALTESVPWSAMGVTHDPAWDDVVVGELLAHTGGMPVARKSWFDDPGSCAIPLHEAMAAPPTLDRGTWVYSNGNYCALGLLIEALTGQTFDVAAETLVFAPLGVTGPHLTTKGVDGSDGPYAPGVARLERLGAAGAWMASSDDVASMLAGVTSTDRITLTWPGIIVDQYGWGHTGTVDGAKACAWVMEAGRTVVVAIVAGNRPSTGGKVCDVVVPALAADLGIWADEPVRSPV